MCATACSLRVAPTDVFIQPNNPGVDGVRRRLDSEIGASLKNYGHFHRQSLGLRLPLLTQEAGGARSGRFSKVVPHWQREGSWHFFTPGPGCVLGDTSCKHTASVTVAELVNRWEDSSPKLLEFSALDLGCKLFYHHLFKVASSTQISTPYICQKHLALTM